MDDFIEYFTFHSVGAVTKNVYFGDFGVKTVLSRYDQFLADQKRREILGQNPKDALEGLFQEAFMLGQLYVRIVKSPPFWANSNFGLLLPDHNIILELFQKSLELEQKTHDLLAKKAEQVAANLNKELRQENEQKNNNSTS